MTIHNALVGTGLRTKVRIGASGKVATGNDIVKRIIQGADYTNSARAMMMATGCIQSQRCHTSRCPVGVAIQDPHRARALDVADKSERVYRYQRATVAQAMQIMASMGVSDPSQLNPHMLRKRLSQTEQRSYAELSSGSHRENYLTTCRPGGGRIGISPIRIPSLRPATKPDIRGGEELNASGVRIAAARLTA